MNKIIVQYQPFIMQQKIMLLDEVNKPMSMYNVEMDEIPNLIATLSKNNVSEIDLVGHKEFALQQEQEITEKVNNENIKILFI